MSVDAFIIAENKINYLPRSSYLAQRFSRDLFTALKTHRSKVVSMLLFNEKSITDVYSRYAVNK